jgi:predicted transposase/invertase (TIGR01784 family)
MVRDLLHGFAARDWSAELDLGSLTPLPASYVSHDLRQRHGDLVWRLRFRDERWLYVVLLLEFQSAVDRSMAVRMLTYTALLYQKLIAEGVLRERSVLPPVLPVVIYNGRRPWTVPVDVAELIASGRGASLAQYQPSQRYFLLDEGRVGGADLPSGNLVSALIALETTRDRLRAPELLDALIDLLHKQDDEELTAAFNEWVVQVLLPRRFRGSVSGPLPRLEEVRTMLAETVQEWTAEWVEQGREQGREQGIQQGVQQGQRALLCRQAARKFDAATGQRLAAALDGVADSDRLAQVGDWIIECETAAELFARFQDGSP